MVLLVLLIGNSALPAAENRPEAKAAAGAEGITSQQAEAILGELREIRLLLEKISRAPVPTAPGTAAAPPPPPTVSLKTNPDWQMLGDKNAPLTMIEFVDFQCPFCKNFDATTFADIRKNLIDTGKLRYFSRNYPLDFHAFAMKAALAAECASEQGKFWRMREVLLANSANLAVGTMAGHARTAGLDPIKFQQCFDSGRYDEAIKSSIKEGASVGVQGTPSFVLGKTTPEGVTGTMVVGALPYASFEAEIKKVEAK